MLTLSSIFRIFYGYQIYNIKKKRTNVWLLVCIEYICFHHGLEPHILQFKTHYYIIRKQEVIEDNLLTRSQAVGGRVSIFNHCISPTFALPMLYARHCAGPLHTLCPII